MQMVDFKTIIFEFRCKLTFLSCFLALKIFGATLACREQLMLEKNSNKIIG